jgi:hypothetical protein
MQDADSECRRVQPAAKAPLRQFTGDDPAARFRRRALAWAVAK